MKQTITRTRVLEIVAGYDKVKDLSGIKLAYAISKNMNSLKREQESINAAIPKSEKLEKYKEEYQVILNAEAKKDESGNFIPAGEGQIVLTDAKSFTKKIKTLSEKYKVELDTQKINEDKFNSFLTEDFEFDFFQFGDVNLPETLTVEQMAIINEMIFETPEAA